MDSNNRIKFYSVYDIATNHQLNRIPLILDRDFARVEYTDVNEIIELSNIKKCIDAGLTLPDWSDSQIDRYKSICKCDIIKRVAVYFRTITDKNIIAVYNSIERKYYEDFWELYDSLKLYNSITPGVFLDLLYSSKPKIPYILRHKRIVSAYDRIIRDYLLSHPEHAVLLMKEYLEKQDAKTKMYFPQELTSIDKADLIAKYIEQPDANPNYVELVAKSNGSNELPIDDRLKLRARKLHKQWVETHIDFDSGISFSVSVRFVDSDEALDYSKNDLSVEFNYGIKWFKENMDCPTLLNNFIHLFGIVDDKFRCILGSSQNNMSIFERIMGVKGKTEYNAGSGFIISDMISSSQITGYRSFLVSQKIQIESLFKWFFECYLPLEFGVTGFTYDSPSSATTIVEKCRALAISMDGILKQFRMYCKDGDIDRELFELSSEHVFFDRIPSMIFPKYIYTKSEVIKNEMLLCYSDQSLLTYNKKTKGKYANLPQMLLSERFSLNDFEHFQKAQIEFLIQRELVQVDACDYLNVNINRAFILNELYQNEVICYAYCSPDIQFLIDRLVDTGDLTTENSLFSKPEQNYLNYMLNKAEYSNGLDIRNKYLHATNPQSEKEIFHDYIELFKITALTVIKINEEFCLRFPLIDR